MYRAMNYKILFLSACAVLLSACGQSGALYLPNDPNQDKRAQFLLYSEKDTAKTTESKDSSVQADASSVESTTP